MNPKALRGQRAPTLGDRKVERCPLAGFQVIAYGRLGVIPEARRELGNRREIRGLRKPRESFQTIRHKSI
jgi:hypothetical protein